MFRAYAKLVLILPHPLSDMDTSPRVDQISSLCVEFVRGAAQSDAPLQLARDISNGHSHLVTVVEALGEHLTSTDVDVRGRATLLLCELVGKLESGLLNADEVHYLSTFFCDRLKDSSLITPYVLQGLVSLITHHPLSDEDAVSVVRSLYKEIHAQSLQQTHRYKLFNILRLMVNKKLKAMRAVSSEFLLGYVQAVDGEKDPRCLMLVFTTVPTIASHIELDPLTEDLFEVVSCYYPIDFTPSPNDPFGISRDQLATRLRECLTATPAFAEYTIPLVLEKLSSSLPSAKLESLLTLSTGLDRFGFGPVKPFLELLWDALRQEVFEPVSNDIETAACAAISTLTRTLATPAQRYGEQNSLEKFINLTLKDCLRYLSDSGVLMQSASRVLLAVCSGSYTACSTILDHCMPVIVQCMTSHNDQSKVCGVLEFVSELVNLATTSQSSPVLEHTHSLLTYLLSMVKGGCDVKVMVAVVRVVGVLVRPMTQQEARDCAEWLLRLGEETDNSQLSKECDTVWSTLSQYQQHVIVEYVIPVISSGLCDTTEYTKATVRVVTLTGIISSHREIATKTFPLLLNMLHKIGLYCSDNVDLAVTVCIAIQSMLKSMSVSEPEFCCQCLTELLTVCVQSVLNGALAHSHVLAEEKVIKSISECFGTHSLINDIRLSHLLAARFIEVFSKGDLSHLNITSSQRFEPLNPSSPWQHTQLLSLLTATIDSIKPKVVEGLAEELLPQLLSLCSEHTHMQSCVHAAKCYATIINKLPEGSALDDILGTAVNVVRCWFASEEDTRLRALTWWIWVTKALVLRSHPKKTEFVSLLLSLFSDSTLGQIASDAFKIILDCSDVIHNPTHSNIKLLYKQQFFITTAPELVKLFHANQSSVVRRHCLCSLSHMMHYVPRQVVLSDLPTILPLLMESLQARRADEGEDDDDELQVSTLESIYTLMQDTPAVVGPHVPALVPRLLELAQSSPRMLVRIAALKCIGGLTVLPHHTIFPYLATVIHGLKVCLDDKKRLVRKHAVSSRSQWCLLGTSQ